MIRLRGDVWRKTLAHLRACGSSHVECVVLWTGPLDAEGIVDDAVHPAHESTPFHYEIDQGWLHRFHVQLYKARRTIRAQVHTHQGRAFHSPTDDRWPAIRTSGFLSLVLPRFAQEPLSVEEMWLAVLEQAGQWSATRADDLIEGIAV